MKTIKPPDSIKNFLTEERNFKMNGYDFYKSYPVTNFENDWEEEVYVSYTRGGYEVYYPSNEKRNITLKTETDLIFYINLNHQ